MEQKSRVVLHLAMYTLAKKLNPTFWNSSVSDHILKVLDPAFCLLNLAFLTFDPTQKGLILQFKCSFNISQQNSLELLDQLLKR